MGLSLTLNTPGAVSWTFVAADRPLIRKVLTSEVAALKGTLNWISDCVSLAKFVAPHPASTPSCKKLLLAKLYCQIAPPPIPYASEVRSTIVAVPLNAVGFEGLNRPLNPFVGVTTWPPFGVTSAPLM